MPSSRAAPVPSNLMRISVAIKSCHRNHARRQAIRETWLTTLPTDFFFVLGSPRLVIPDTLACDVSDKFEDIAPKVLCACMSALDHNADYLFVCDDDTYVRPARLLASGYEKHDYCGWVRPYGDRSTGGLPYIQGAAYWLSARAMEYVVSAGEKIMRPGIIDDGAVGMALYGKVPFTHDSRYRPGPEYRDVAQFPDWITAHKCTPDGMRVLHREVLRGDI